MAWTRTKTAGLAIGLLILVCISVSSILIYRHCNQLPRKRGDIEQARLPDNDERKSSSKTFYGWVRSVNSNVETPSIDGPVRSSDEQQQGHERYPSLEYGPGPVIHSRTTNPHPSTTATAQLKPERPGTSDSTKVSSLRRAVMDVGSLERKENAKPVERNLEAEAARAKGYTGTWP